MLLKFIFSFLFIFSLLAQDLPSELQKASKLELTFNSHQTGDAVEIGYATKPLFKLRESSRHHWGFFGTVGANTVYNTSSTRRSEVKDSFNLEVISGFSILAPFYKDFILQYGKIAADYVYFDKDINSSGELGAMMESGLEFRAKDVVKKLLGSSVESPFAVNLGLRWRFGFPKLDRLQTPADPIEGASLVLGTRLYF